MDWNISRRGFLGAAGTAALVSACGKEKTETPTPGEATGAPTATSFKEPAKKLSGSLSILLWSHFVPSHDEWFKPFAQEWGKQVGVNVTVDHIANTEIVGRLSSEIAAGSGHDLVQYIAPLSAFEPSLLDMKDVLTEAEKRYGTQVDICRRTSQNPHTGKYYAFSPGWVPDPGNYRKSLWSEVGLPNGPTTWDELYTGGKEIVAKKKIHMGLGMSQEIDSNMAARALIWSYGGAEQDENENVTVGGEATIEAANYMAKLFKDTMTAEVFGWNPASNNQGLIAGKLSYIINSISAWRSAQGASPAVADDVFFTKAIQGPKGGLAAQHVLYNWVVPKHAKNPDAAKEFLLHYTENMSLATFHSKLYDFPAFPKTVPNLNTWLGNDPFSATNKDKLKVLTFEDALKWTTNIGQPGSASPAIGEAFGTFVLPNMFAKVARGQATPQAAVKEAEAAYKAIFAKWRRQGLIGGSN